MAIHVLGRDGIRDVHRANFILVVTMKSELEELRSPLLDWFGVGYEFTTPMVIECRFVLGVVLERRDRAMGHRCREPLSDKPEQVQELACRAAEQVAQIQATTPTETAQPARGDAPQQEGASGGESNEGWTTAEARESPSTEAVDVEPDTVIQLRTFAVKKLDLPRERQARPAPGKRTSTKSETKHRRYARSSQTEKVTDVAFDAT